MGIRIERRNYVKKGVLEKSLRYAYIALAVYFIVMATYKGINPLLSICLLIPCLFLGYVQGKLVRNIVIGKTFSFVMAIIWLITFPIVVGSYTSKDNFEYVVSIILAVSTFLGEAFIFYRNYMDIINSERIEE